VTDRDRAVGALVGLACGDALGRPVASRSSESVAREHGRVTQMLADGTHGQPAGTVTDDADLTLAVARSLVARGGFDADDRTAAAIRRHEGASAGDGRPARCVPHALAYGDRARLAAVVARASAVTRVDPRHVESRVALARVLRELVEGAPPDDALGAALAQARDRDAPDGVRERLAVAAEPEARRTNDGSVLDTLETALTDALTADSAADAVVTTVSRGGDADAVGAVCGAVAGARFGASAVPARWVERVDATDECRALAADLVALDPD
jgi:ADP-ribosyl-[dinitrogen reductase] hydrolase